MCVVFDQMKAVASIRGRSFRAIGIDLIGHGRSDKPMNSDAYTITEIVADIEAVISQFGSQKRNILIGHSMGGGLITALAAFRSKAAAELKAASPDSANADRLP